MSDSTADRCPRCGGGFHCGMADDGPCACTSVHLDATLQQQLRECFTGCLCLRCLAALAQGEGIALESSFQGPRGESRRGT